MTLALDNVTVSVGKTTILSMLNARLPDRGLVAITGPNGSGKSTFLDLLSGFRERSGGTVMLKGKAVSSSTLQAKTGRLHQSIVLPQGVSVMDFLQTARGDWSNWERLFARRLLSTELVESGVSADLDSILSAAGINDSRIDIGSLSWGQQRLVAICAILDSNSEILLLDEPLAGLASELRGLVGDAIFQRAKARLIVMVEHDLNLAHDLADTVVQIDGGRIVEQFDSESARSP